MRNRFLLVLVLALAASLLLLGCGQKTTHLTILYMNDLHGHLERFKEGSESAEKVGGIDRMANLVKKTREEVTAEGGHLILLCAGDILQGTPMSLIFKGEPDVTVMNYMKFDAMAIGNHEFDYGQENLKRLMGLASFPFLSANIVSPSTQKLFATDYIVNSYDGLNVAMFGLTTDETPVATHPDNVADLEFLPPIETAKDLVPALKKKAQVVIALTHIGFEMDEQLAEEVPDIDVIIGGHSHTRVDSTVHVGQTLVCQAYEYGICLGRADITVKGGHVVQSRSTLLSVDNTVDEDTLVSELVSSYADKLDKELARTVGTAAVRLDGERTAVRDRETNLGDLVTDAMRQLTGADIAFTNGGSIRASIDAGEITMREILTALPFEDKLVNLTLTGDQVASIVDQTAGLKSGSGGFLQVSGISFKIRNRKASDIEVAGQPLDEKRNYRVATSEFLAAGGDGYKAFKQGTDYYNTGLKISDVVVDHIRTRSEVGRKVETRIVRE
jgi:5'-nucleotidase/UDP-sugar diphosphatase